MRPATKEERESVDRYIESISHKTGIIWDVMRIIDDAEKKAGDKTYIVLDDGRFYSQAKYIKEKTLELLDE